MKNNFLWGAATSAYQVEGGINNDWSRSGMDAGIAANHYFLFEKDFGLAKSLGHNAHRFSIEWARIEPEEGKFDHKELAHYQKVINALHARGMEPFVTLWHFTNPVWFADKGGFAKKKNLKYFDRYVDFLAQNLEEVKFWITTNEPEIYAFNSYLRGVWPPFKKSLLNYFNVLQNLIATHKSAYRIIHRNAKDAEVGIAKNNSYFECGTKNPLDMLLARFIKWWWNERILNSIKDCQDFIGLNYYFHNRIKNLKFNQNENASVSDLGWEIYPEGLYHVLKDLQKYHKPIYITENGLADATDAKRAEFIKGHIECMKKAKEEGTDVRGYFYWSLIDNYEWDKGFEPRFGLVEVDYKTMERKIRKSAWIYRDN